MRIIASFMKFSGARMRSRFAAGAVLTSAVLFAAASSARLHVAAMAKSTAAPAASKEMHEELDWREDRARRLSAPDGWLTLVGLEWLKPGKNTVGLAADNAIRLGGHAPEHLGVIEVDGNQLRLFAPAGGFSKFLYVDGQPAHEGPLQSDDGKPSLLSTENLSLVVLHRGDRFAVRIKDSESPTRTGFRGLHWYPIETKYRVTAKWIPFVPVHTEK